MLPSEPVRNSQVAVQLQLPDDAPPCIEKGELFAFIFDLKVLPAVQSPELMSPHSWFTDNKVSAETSRPTRKAAAPRPWRRDGDPNRILNRTTQRRMDLY